MLLNLIIRKMSNIFFILFYIFLRINIIKSICIENTNNCLKCNPLTNYCVQCMYENLIPDINGGCEGFCILGNNYCLECEENGSLCLKCEENFFQDKMGGCSYTKNCEFSIKGNCLRCIDEYFLFGEENNLLISLSFMNEL